MASDVFVHAVAELSVVDFRESCKRLRIPGPKRSASAIASLPVLAPLRLDLFVVGKIIEVQKALLESFHQLRQLHIIIAVDAARLNRCRSNDPWPQAKSFESFLCPGRNKQFTLIFRDVNCQRLGVFFFAHAPQIRAETTRCKSANHMFPQNLNKILCDSLVIQKEATRVIHARIGVAASRPVLHSQGIGCDNRNSRFAGLHRPHLLPNALGRTVRFFHALTERKAPVVTATLPEISVFEHAKFGELRIVDRDGQQWFIAIDITKSLGFGNPRQALASHCRGVQKMDTPTKSGIQAVSIIPESDVYRLVMRSKLPEAEAFQDWVCEEVLPQIRRMGSYQPDETYEQLSARVLSMANAKIAEQQAKIEADASKVEFHDRVTGSETVCQLGVACQVAGLPFGRNTLFRRLRDQGVLISTGDRKNHPRQEYVDRGLFTVVEHEYMDDDTGKTHLTFVTHATQRGVEWLIKRFAS